MIVRGLVVIVLAILGVSTVEAGMMGRGRFGGGLGRGALGGGQGFSADSVQDIFTDKYEDIVTDYEEGEDVIEDLETLVERHDSYVERVEGAPEKIDETIVSVTEKITDLEEQLLEYQEDEEISEEKLERVEEFISTRIDSLYDKIDSLTGRQTDIEELLPSILEFNEEISSYLEDLLNDDSSSDGDDDTDSEDPVDDSGTDDETDATDADEEDDVVALVLEISSAVETISLTSSSTASAIPIETVEVAGMTIPEPGGLSLMAAATLLTALRSRKRPRT